MANTYTQCYFHLVFAVRFRQALIQKEWREELEKYMTSIIQKHGHKLLAIYAEKDHIHILIGYNVNHLIPELVEEVKTSATHWIKRNHKTNSRFAWQKGYGAFTHCRSSLDNVVKYILNQENHHLEQSFKKEYLKMLEQYDVAYNDLYLFEFFEE